MPPECPICGSTSPYVRYEGCRATKGETPHPFHNPAPAPTDKGRCPTCGSDDPTRCGRTLPGLLPTHFHGGAVCPILNDGVTQPCCLDPFHTTTIGEDNGSDDHPDRCTGLVQRDDSGHGRTSDGPHGGPSGEPDPSAQSRAPSVVAPSPTGGEGVADAERELHEKTDLTGRRCDDCPYPNRSHCPMRCVVNLEAVLEAAHSQIENLRDALDYICGGIDREPWVTIYRDAGGGYEGLQAVARSALANQDPEVDDG
jgi:hypothetical protein